MESQPLFRFDRTCPPGFAEVGDFITHSGGYDFYRRKRGGVFAVGSDNGVPRQLTTEDEWREFVPSVDSVAIGAIGALML